MNIKFGVKTNNYVSKKLTMGRNFFALGRILQRIIMQMITNYLYVNGEHPQLKIFASLKI